MATTFLDMCQNVSRDQNTGGSLSTVSGQIGLFDKLVNFVAQADYDIQKLSTNWKFLLKEWELLTVLGQALYDPPSDIGDFDTQSFWIFAGTTDACHLEYADYKEWRDNLRHSYLTNDDPCFVTLKPSGGVLLSPAPDTNGDKITCDYWRRPVRMVNDSDISIIPEMYLATVESLAKMYLAENRHDNGWYQSNFAKFQTGLLDLNSGQLPGQENESKSEADEPMIIRVV